MLKSIEDMVQRQQLELQEPQVGNCKTMVAE